MFMSPVGRTARWVAAQRAQESKRAERLFEDPLAEALAGEDGFAMAAAAREMRPALPKDAPDPYIPIRTAFLDEALMRAATEGALRQIVVLAAGLDARAFRLSWPPGTRLWELDRDEIFDHKEAVLRAAAARPTCERVVVRADLAHEWVTPLIRAGFDPIHPAAFLVEGLLPYLDAAAVDSLFGAIGQVAAPGSWIGLDVVGNSMLTSPYVTKFLAYLKQTGCPWHFGTDEPEALLNQHGWSATVVCPGEPGAHFGRWPYPVLPRDMPGIPRSYLVTGWRRG
jgi:methyltransferase (TIGR00027 family)